MILVIAQLPSVGVMHPKYILANTIFSNYMNIKKMKHYDYASETCSSMSRSPSC